MERDPEQPVLQASAHLKPPSRARSVLLALAALALASPAYLFVALNRPAVVVLLNDTLDAKQDVVVKVGEAVVWRNESNGVRTLEVHEGSERRSAVLEPGDTYVHTFHEPGLHHFCAAEGPRDSPRDGVITVEP